MSLVAFPGCLIALERCWPDVCRKYLRRISERLYNPLKVLCTEGIECLFGRRRNCGEVRLLIQPTVGEDFRAAGDTEAVAKQSVALVVVLGFLNGLKGMKWHNTT